jgi:hypothetical protein
LYSCCVRLILMPMPASNALSKSTIHWSFFIHYKIAIDIFFYCSSAGNDGLGPTGKLSFTPCVKARFVWCYP